MYSGGSLLAISARFSAEYLEYGPLVLVVDPCFSAVETLEFAASIEEEGTDLLQIQFTHCARAYITRGR